MAERALAGYTYQDRVSVGFFGEIFRAHDADGEEVRIVHVDPELSEQEGFTEALAAQTRKLQVLEHERVLATRKVVLLGGEVVVITAPIAGPVSLEGLVRDAGGGLPGDVALGIFGGAVEGLAYAHSLGIVHGCVHPRSVLIDFHGGVKLADFGLAHAYAEAVIRSRKSAPSGSAAGYVAPELARGERPSVASDVYAAGALLFSLLGGAPPPGELDTTPGLKEIADKALSRDASARFLNGTDLEEALEEAIPADGRPVALPADIASFVTEQRSRAEASLDQETEDLLAEIGAPDAPGGGEAEKKAPGRRVASVLDDLELESDSESEEAKAPGRGVSEVLADLASDSEGPASEPPQVPVPDDEVGFDDFSTSGDLTEVDDPRSRARAADDPISEIIRLGSSAEAPSEPVAGDDEEEEKTPLPEPMPYHDRPGSTTRAREAGAPAPDPEPEREPAAATPAPDVPAPEDLLAPRKKNPVFLWLGITVFVLASLLGVLYTQTDVFHPERARAEEERREREREEALERAREGRPQRGTVVVDSAPAEAAVWLLLGRTPLDTIPLPAGRVHELRLEHDGYLPLDLPVTSIHWSTEEGEPRAEVRGKLVPGEPKGPASAYPPEPKKARAPGPSGIGTIHVESEPQGAEVWLLVGFTPEARVSLIAGRSYEFKLLKDGYRPGFAVVKEGQWYLSGPDGVIKPKLTRSVELAPRR